MKTLNKVFLIGYIASEIADHRFENGTSCCNFQLKTRDFYGASGSKKVDKNYHNIIMWNGIGEMASTVLKKDDVVYIEGKIKNKRIEDKDGGKPIYRTEINVTEWTKLSARESTQEVESDED